MAEGQELSICASEPIHIPGLVQGFGCLVVLDQHLHVQYISANADRFFAGRPHDLVGAPLGQFIDGSLCPELMKVVIEPTLPRKISLQRVRFAAPPAHLANVSLHQKGNLRVLEFEPCLVDGQQQTEPQYLSQQQRLQARLYQALSTLQDGGSLAALSEEAVEAVREITGYDRVMVYRFDSAWRGTVIAEDKVEQMASYMGQSFPASDIPPQAREVFRHNASRMIHSIQAQPVALLPAAKPGISEPFDMGETQLRAASPVHLEYLENMEVEATLTLTLLVQGRLWGLVACHHRTAHVTDVAHREAAEIVAKAYAALIPTRIYADNDARRTVLRNRLTQLTTKLQQSDDAPICLMEGDTCLAQLWTPSQSEAAMLLDGKWRRTSGAPGDTTCSAIISHLRAHHSDKVIFHTHHVQEALPGIELDPQVCSGLLAIQLVKEEDSCLLWFAPEVPQAIDWAGRPEKRTVQQAAGQRVHPRLSFKLWREALRGHSAPWTDLELETALQLRRALIEWDLARKVRREQEARAEVEKEKQRFGLLAAASAFFGKPLGDGAALQGLAQFLTSQFCDWVVITGTDDEHSAHEAWAHRNAACQDLLASATSSGELMRALSKRLANVDNALAMLPVAEEQKDICDLLGTASCVHLPLRVHQRVLGDIYFVRGPKSVRFDPDDVRLAIQLAERVAGVLDNDRSFRQSQSAIRSREYVLRIVSHDLRNPLGVVSLSAQSLRRKLKSKACQEVGWQEPVNRIERACTTMERLIGDVLSAANIESGSFQVRPEWLRAATLLSEVSQALEPLCQAAHIRLQTTLAHQALEIYGDKNRLLQAMGNLVSNAIRFTPAQGTITLGITHDGTQSSVTVRDTGAGIAAAKVDKIFDQFWQGDQGAQSGAGLGLFIVRGIVQAHGGRIQVTSKVDEGTTFTFTCPDPAAKS